MSARKRARTDFAAPTEDDNNPSSAVGDPSSSALSTRRPRYASVPPLTVLCSRVFANNYVALRNREKLWARVSELLRDMPDSLRPLLLADLKRVCPTYLKSEFIVAYFFHGHTLTLSDLPGLTNQSIRSLDRMKDLRELELSGFGKVPDNIFAGALRHLAKLRRLVLRGCSLVGPKTMGAIVSKELRILNLNYTTVTPPSLQPLLLACSANLEVLKLASIPNWVRISRPSPQKYPNGYQTDTTFRKLLTPDLSLPRLHTLKLCRLSLLSEGPVNEFLALCPALRRLDISFTAVRHPFHNADPLPPLEKVYLTSTSIPNAELLSLLSRLSSLTSLGLGAMGASPRSIAAIDSSMTMTDSVMEQLIPHLQALPSLTKLSLVGNTKLSRSLGPFVSTVGRNCKWLNLSGIHGLRSQHLAGLVPDIDQSEAPARLETLLLNTTGLDDDAAPFLAACPELTWLEVAETKMTSDGLFTVLDACKKLETLGLKSCRGVRIGDRRRFFEAWEEDRANK